MSFRRFQRLWTFMDCCLYTPNPTNAVSYRRRGSITPGLVALAGRILAGRSQPGCRRQEGEHLRGGLRHISGTARRERPRDAGKDEFSLSAFVVKFEQAGEKIAWAHYHGAAGLTGPALWPWTGMGACTSQVRPPPATER